MPRDEPDDLSRTLDPPLRAVIERSYADRVAGVSGAELNLANAWWSPGEPVSAWDALRRVGPTGLNVMVRIHEHMRVIDPSLALWGTIRYIRNVWWGGSAGFKVVWVDATHAREILDGLWPRVVRDGILGALEHQRRPPLALMIARPFRRWLDEALELPDATTWREVTPLGAESVHLCVGKLAPRDPALDDIHLDWRSPVRGIDARTRRLRYAWCAGAQHWAQAKLGWGAPRFPFVEMAALIAKVEARRVKQRIDGAAMRAWDDLVARWRDVEWRLAARGAEGLARAQALLREAEALARLAAA
ncbi:MAG: hypothetical protein QM820_26290 [Minicystis sp.]